MANFPTEFSLFATKIGGTPFNLDVVNDRVDSIPVPTRSLFRRIVIHVELPPNAPAVLSLFKNQVDTGQAVTVPTTIPTASGIELSWPTPVLYLAGEFANVRVDGAPTNSSIAHITYVFDRNLREDAPRSRLPTEFALFASIFTTGIQLIGDTCEDVAVPEKAFLKRAVLRNPSGGPNADTTLIVFKNGLSLGLPGSITVLEDSNGGFEYAFPAPILCQKGDLITLLTLGECTNVVNPRCSLVFDRSGVP